MTDNAWAYRSKAYRASLADRRQTRTRPYRPQTNGKAERFIGTLVREWAYARTYATNAARLAKHGATLLAQMQVSARAIGLKSMPTEAVITTDTNHLLLRRIDGHAGVAVHILLRADQTTPSQARADLDRIPPPV